MPPDTIAFVSTYEHPSRDSVERMVREAFPEYRVENIVLKDVVKAHLRWLVPNAAFVAAEYGARIARGDLSLRDGYFQTTFLLRKIRAAMRSIIDPARHVFSFQTQSLYDTSVPGVPHFLYTDHTHLSNLQSPFFDRRQLRGERWRQLERGIYHHATRVFTRSHNINRDLETQYGIAADRAVCVYAGPNADVSEALPDNDDYRNRRILFVGGDWERKGGPELAAAFEQVLRVVPDAQLTVIGATPALTLPNCQVLGPLPIREVGRHFTEASIFCLPTRLEPFGIVVLEAMLHRLPVVGSTEGALPDMIEDRVTGRLVPPGEPAPLAAALIELLEDPVRCRDQGAAGYRLARERYTWPAVGRRIRAEVLRAIGPRAGAGSGVLHG
jgi:glycosyltransferase involved in cell wall biosynthesis